MISFSKLGSFGRLGNQLFQYAYLRTMAARLGVPFYCPRWDGDAIFDLAEGDARSAEPAPMRHFFDAHPEAGYTERALQLADETEIQGYFQSERYFAERQQVLGWYRFKPAIQASVFQRHPPARLENAVSLSLRIDGDYANTREYFPLYPLSYYEQGLRRVGPADTVLVFSDRPDLARRFFGRLRGLPLVFVEGLSGPEQLFLMSQCRANILTNSTFAWWGGWLNARADRSVVAPSAWCRPGVPRPITGILCEDWIQLPGTTPVIDHFQVWRLRHPWTTGRRVWRRLQRSR